MTIGHAIQKGGLVYIYDEKGHMLSSIGSGRGPLNGLTGYTSSTVTVRKGGLIYTYNEKGHLLSSTGAK